MTTQKFADPLPPPQAEDFPPLKLLYQRIMPLENGCEIWIGSFHPKTGPFIKWHKRQVQVHRALWFYAYGILPPFKLLRTCESSACVAVAHRSVSACV